MRLQNINEIQEIENPKYKAPEFDETEFKKNRFGVYSGPIESIKLKIEPNSIRYFLDRTWHPSSKISQNEAGEYILTMKAPIAPDLVGWIISWADAITVIKPESLRKEVIEKLNLTFNKYQ